MKNITLNNRNCNILLSSSLNFTLDELKNKTRSVTGP
jgi:hypothetical protein